MIVGLYIFFGSLLITYLVLAIILIIGELLLFLFIWDSDYSDFLVQGIKTSILCMLS